MMTFRIPHFSFLYKIVDMQLRTIKSVGSALFQLLVQPTTGLNLPARVEANSVMAIWAETLPESL